MKLLDKLFRKKPGAAPRVPADGPYLTQTVVFGMHQYRRDGDDSSVYFVDEKRGIRKMLVDSEGRIQQFPGIVREDFWAGEVSANALEPQICFRTSFEKRKDRWLMLWEIQPDGQYWADDDGFGIENDPEVILYTYVDSNGNFTDPFRIYGIGEHHYCLDRFEDALEELYPEDLQKLKMGSLETKYYRKPEDILFPRLRNTPDKHTHDCQIYALWDREEALAYWNHPVLSAKLLEATEILRNTQKPINEVGHYGCQYRIRASMTLFWLATGDPRFRAALDQFFGGKLDPETEKALRDT